MIRSRHCPIREGSPECLHCRPCAILDGWGGAGAFSDGKLTLSPAVGGHLAEILGEAQIVRLIEEADAIYRAYGAPDTVHGTYTDEIELLDKRASLAGLRFISVPIRHMGTERCADIMRGMRDTLIERGVEIRMRTPVTDVLVDNGKVTGVSHGGGRRTRRGLRHPRARTRGRVVA